MKQRTNGRAVRGAARESNGARKGLRVGKAAGCMYTADSESERYEYDKARYIVFRIHRESAARVATRVEGPEGVAVFVFVPRPSSRYANRIPRGSVENPRCRWHVPRRSAREALSARRASPKSHPSTVASISRALEYGKWIRMQQEQPTP